MSDEYSADALKFLVTLYRQTDGDAKRQASMYAIGDEIGVDKNAAAEIAQELMGLSLVDIRTLSGGIGISPTGITEIERLGLGNPKPEDTRPRLDNGPLLSPPAVEAVTAVTIRLKHHAGSMGLDFEALSELMADLKTIDAQMSSSKPKTAIIRAVFESIASILNQSSADIGREEIASLLR